MELTMDDLIAMIGRLYVENQMLRGELEKASKPVETE